MELETITREVVVRGKAEGLDAVARGYEEVAAGAEKATVVVDRQSKVSESAERALNKLKRQIDDNFRASEALARGEETLQRAREQGIIGAQEQERQLALLNARYKEGGKGVSDAGDAATQFGEKFTSATLLVGKASGAFGAVGERVSALSSRLAESGRTFLSGFVQVVGTGLTGLLNPVNLLAAGFAAISVVALVAYATLIDKGRSAEQTLEQQARLVGLVKDRLDETTDASKRLTLAERDTALTKALQTEAELRERIAEAAKSFTATLGHSKPNAVSDIPLPDTVANINDQLEVARKFETLRAPIEKFFESVRRGTPDIETLRGELNQIARIDPSQLKLVDKILGDLEQLDKLTAKLRELREAIDRLQSGPPIDFGELFRKARLDLAKVDEEDDGNKKLIQAEKIRDAHEKYRKLVHAIQNDESGAASTTQRLAEAKRLLGVALEKAVEEEEKERDQYDRALDQVSKQIALTEAETKAIGESAGAHAKLRVEAQLNEAAKRAEREVTAEMRAEIDKLGERARVAADNLALMQLQSKIKFDKATVFFSQDELAVAREMQRIVGDKWPEAMNSKEAADLRAIQSMQQLKGTAESFVTTLADGIWDGTNGMVALKSAVDQLGKSMMNAAIKDLMSGNFEKAGIEAVIAIGAKIATNFIDDGKEAKRLLEAQKAWNNLSDTLASVTAKLHGGTGGGLTGELRSMLKDVVDLAKAAKEAGDVKAIFQLAADWSAYISRVTGDFRSMFAGVVDAMRDGTGFDSPFVKGQQQIQNLTNKVKDFITDTQTAFSGANVNGIGFLQNGPLDASAQIAAAQAAARSLLLAQLSGVPAISEVASALAELDGKAVGVRQALIDLGLSADQATAAIAAARQLGIDKLAADFVDGLERQLNEATGRGFVNQLLDLIEATEKQRADALAVKAAGGDVDTSLIDRLFAAQAQAVVDQADLVGDSFDDLLAMFPDLTGVVHESTTALQKQADAQRQLQDELNDTARDIVDYIAGLQAGSSSTLAPLDKLAAAQSIYNSTLALAQTGNPDAQKRWSSDADNLLKAADAVYASAAGFQAIRNTIIAQGLALPAVVAATDPVVVAVRDAIVAIQATTSAVVVGNDAVLAALDLNHDGLLDQSELLGFIRGDTATTVTRLDTSIGKFDTTITKLGDTVSRLDTALGKLDSALSKLDTSISLLDAIRGLQTTANAQLALLQDALVQGPLTGLSGQVVPPSSNSDAAITALRKIVYNTGVIAYNTNVADTRPTGVFGAYGTFAQGGWINGGVPGRDSVPILAMPDEFMLKRDATRALTARYGAGVLENYLNRGLLPPANDNWMASAPVAFASAPAAVGGIGAAELRELVAELRNIARVIAQGANAEIKETKDLRSATVAGLDQVAGAIGQQKRKPRTMVGAAA